MMAWHPQVSMELSTASTNSPCDVFTSNHLDEFYKHLSAAHLMAELEAVAPDDWTSGSTPSSFLSNKISDTSGDGENITQPHIGSEPDDKASSTKSSQNPSTPKHHNTPDSVTKAHDTTKKLPTLKARAKKEQCHMPNCGRMVSDMQKHLITHEAVRPMKCPLKSCEYHEKGFARLYDRDRHIATHYRAYFACHFCNTETELPPVFFNRVECIKTHLVKEHGVISSKIHAKRFAKRLQPTKEHLQFSDECLGPASVCPVCFRGFENAQEYHDHFEDCIPVQIETLGGVDDANILNLSLVEADIVGPKNTKDKNWKHARDEEERQKPRFGLTYSIGGMSRHFASQSATRPKSVLPSHEDYPAAWEQLESGETDWKKRVLCVYDGQRRLLKDDMKVHLEYDLERDLKMEHRMLTYHTFRRANAFHLATEEERGPWVPDNIRWPTPT